AVPLVPPKSKKPKGKGKPAPAFGEDEELEGLNAQSSADGAAVGRMVDAAPVSWARGTINWNNSMIIVHCTDCFTCALEQPDHFFLPETSIVDSICVNSILQVAALKPKYRQLFRLSAWDGRAHLIQG
ncbi:1803_t:CDS:2, partial [Acaulospora colombiana]